MGAELVGAEDVGALLVGAELVGADEVGAELVGVPSVHELSEMVSTKLPPLPVYVKSTLALVTTSSPVRET